MIIISNPSVQPKQHQSTNSRPQLPHTHKRTYTPKNHTHKQTNTYRNDTQRLLIAKRRGSTSDPVNIDQHFDTVKGWGQMLALDPRTVEEKRSPH